MRRKLIGGILFVTGLMGVMFMGNYLLLVFNKIVPIGLSETIQIIVTIILVLFGGKMLFGDKPEIKNVK